MTATNYILSNYTLIPLLNGFKHAPRFGHTPDVSLLFSHNSQDPYRYALGTICISGIIAGFFFVWALVLIFFIFMGPVKVGFLSGFHMRQPKSTVDNDESGVDFHLFKLPRKVHSTFLFTSAMVIVCSVLLVVQGVQPFLKQSRGTDLFPISSNGGYDADSVIQSFNRIESIAPVYIDEILPSRFCASINAPLSLDQTRNATMFQLSNFSLNFKADTYYDLRDNVFNELAKRARIFKENIDKYGLKSWHGLAFSIPIIMITFLMMVGTILSWARSTSEWFIFILTWLLLPTLILIVVFSVIGCSAASIILVMNSDFCSGNNYLGPGNTISNILSNYLIPQRYPKLYDGMTYVLNKCQGTSPFSLLNSDQSFVSDTMNTIYTFKQTLNSTGFDGLVSCNVSASQFDTIQAYTTTLYSNLVNISRSVADVSSLVNCATLGPIYENVVYRDVCTQYPQYFMWIFSSLLGISVFGMIMITLRASWLAVQYQNTFPIQLMNTHRSPDSVNDSAASPMRRQRGNSDIGSVYDHETLLSDKYERRDNVSVPSWEDISVADDATIREVRRNQDQYAPGLRIY